jgi:hypothetical protein
MKLTGQLQAPRAIPALTFLGPVQNVVQDHNMNPVTEKKRKKT